MTNSRGPHGAGVILRCRVDLDPPNEITIDARGLPGRQGNFSAHQSQTRLGDHHGRAAGLGSAGPNNAFADRAIGDGQHHGDYRDGDHGLDKDGAGVGILPPSPFQ